jgi:ribose transport system ATP-binding protein
VDGQAQHFRTSRDAEALGIVLIHQELNLADDLTIAQNIFLGHERKRGWLLDDASMKAEARQVLAQVGLSKDPDTPVRQLIVAEKQLVEIAKALARRARLLIMDEPTATLTPGETEALFRLMGRLKADGVTIVYISHKLDEVERNTDEVVVMRDGRFVARAPTASVSRQQMANLMVGRELSDMFPPKAPAPDGPPLLEVHGLSIPGWAHDVSFDLRAGEILGFAGLVGAGRTELFEGLLGLRPSRGGEVRLAGAPVRFASPRDALAAGVAMVHQELAFCENLTVAENLCLGHLPRRWGFVDRAALLERARRLLAARR